MSIDRKSEVVFNENGVKFVKNTFVDAPKNYTRKEARKRKGMLDTYSIEQQLNVMRKAILTIAENENIDLPELEAIENLATELGIK